MSSVYSYENWKIWKKSEDEYLIKKGREIIDRCESFDEAYALLDKHRKSVK